MHYYYYCYLINCISTTTLTNCIVTTCTITSLTTRTCTLRIITACIITTYILATCFPTICILAFLKFSLLLLFFLSMLLALLLFLLLVSFLLALFLVLSFSFFQFVPCYLHSRRFILPFLQAHISIIMKFPICVSLFWLTLLYLFFISLYSTSTLFLNTICCTPLYYRHPIIVLYLTLSTYSLLLLLSTLFLLHLTIPCLAHTPTIFLHSLSACFYCAFSFFSHNYYWLPYHQTPLPTFHPCTLLKYFITVVSAFLHLSHYDHYLIPSFLFPPTFLLPYFIIIHPPTPYFIPISSFCHLIFWRYTIFLYYS